MNILPMNTLEFVIVTLLVIALVLVWLVTFFFWESPKRSKKNGRDGS